MKKITHSKLRKAAAKTMKVNPKDVLLVRPAEGLTHWVLLGDDKELKEWLGRNKIEVNATSELSCMPAARNDHKTCRLQLWKKLPS
jgi:hypothetical protein